MKTIIEQLKSKLDLVQIVSETVSLKKRGANYIGLCPFHSEKTGSFYVFPQKGYFRCFGCQASGDVLNFIAHHKNATLADILPELAEKHSLTCPNSEKREADPAYQKQQSMYLLNRWSHAQFSANAPQAQEQLLALGKSISSEALAHFGIGYCGKASLLSELKGAGQDISLMREIGLVKVGQNQRYYEAYYSRIMFPIKNEKGKVAGFIGRKIFSASIEAPKYLNSPESSIYRKSELMFGWHENFRCISQAKSVVLTEGTLDAIATWEAGIQNVAAICGTALTEAHATLLAKTVSTVILFFDGDEAGKNATISAWKLLESYGVFVRICQIPNGHDPDSWYRECGKDAFSRNFAENTLNAILWFVNLGVSLTNLEEKQKHMELAKDYFATTPFQFVISDWKKELAEKHPDLSEVFSANFRKNQAQSTPSQDFSDNQLNLHCNDGQYYVKRKGKLRSISNFVMTPQYFTEGAHSYRVCEISNTDGDEAIIQTDGSCWTQVSRFCHELESKGNFVFTGEMSDLKKLKQYYFGSFERITKLDSLGYLPDLEVFAWSNGIYRGGTFYVPDKSNPQIVTVTDKKYALPKLSTAQERFRYRDTSITTSQLLADIQTVFEEENSGIIALLFAISATFRHIVFSHCNYFPMLFGFGVPSSGKSSLARAILSFYGNAQKPINLSTSTDKGMYRQSAFVSGSCIWFDEYKNALKPSTIQFLKGLYDGAESLRAAYTNDNETLCNEIRNGVIITGQDLPTQDPALLSRMILLEFKNVHFTAEQRECHGRFEEMIAGGLGKLICTWADLSKRIESQFAVTFKIAINLLRGRLSPKVAAFENTRIIGNYAVLLSIGLLIREKLGLSAKVEDQFISALSGALSKHLELQYGHSDVAQFWEIFETCAETYEVQSGTHFEILEAGEKVTIDCEQGQKILETTEKVLLLRFRLFYDIYNDIFRKRNQRPGLPTSTLNSYLVSSKEFVGKVKSHRFANSNTSAYAFKLAELPITIQ